MKKLTTGGCSLKVDSRMKKSGGDFVHTASFGIVDPVQYKNSE